MLAGFVSISVDRRRKGENFRQASGAHRAHCGQVCPEQGVLRPSAAAPDGDSGVGNGGREWLNDEALALLNVHKGAVGAAVLTVEGVSAPDLWLGIQLSQAKPGHHRAGPRQRALHEAEHLGLQAPGHALGVGFSTTKSQQHRLCHRFPACRSRPDAP